MVSIGVDIGRKNLAIAVWRVGEEEVVCHRPELPGRGCTFVKNVMDFLAETVPEATTVVVEDQRDATMAKIAGAIVGFYYPNVTKNVFLRAPIRNGGKTYRDRKRASVDALAQRFGTVSGMKMDDVADAVALLDREVGIRAKTLSVVVAGGAPVLAVKNA